MGFREVLKCLSGDQATEADAPLLRVGDGAKLAEEMALGHSPGWP